MSQVEDLELYAMLLKSGGGYKEEKDRGQLKPVTVYKGTLLVYLDSLTVKRIREKYTVGRMNCKVADRCENPQSGALLFATGSSILHITTLQRDFLLGVKQTHYRMEMMKRLQWVESLTVGSDVYVKIATIPTPVRGIIRYIGELPGEEGTKFGIELMERRGQGTHNGEFKGHKYFECDKDCAVFVAMDKITELNAAEAAKVTKTVDDSVSKQLIKINDCVAFYDKYNILYRGVAKWIGNYTKIVVVGIEVEGDLCLADFPNHIYAREDRQLFSSKKSKIFLPITHVRPDTSTQSGVKDNCTQSENVTKDEVFDSQNLAVGSVVQHLDKYGVIKWIGTPSGSRNEATYAGVEMEDVDPFFGGDGSWGNVKYFNCEPNKGKFVLLNSLKPDQRIKKGSNSLRKNTVVIRQDPMTSGNHIEQSKSNHDNESTDVSSTANVEQKIYVVEREMKSYIEKSEETIQRMEASVDNAFQKALEVQSINKELQVNNTGTQQQLLDMQKSNERLQASNEHLQSQMLTILDKLSHTQQQLLETRQQMLDMQKSNEQLQKANALLQDQLSLTMQKLIDAQKNNDLSQANLQNQLSLTQQQLLGVQSMMTCSRLWVVSHDQFKIGREIGRGAWASVHETTFRGAKVAAKRLHDEITSPETIELFHQEMKMALHCQHQNIVTFLGVTLENHPVILMELMDVSLRSAYKRGNVKYQQVLKIFYDIASALHFLHTRPDPLIHRDVSSANVLLKDCGNEKWLAKLGDLGTAKLQQYCTTPGPGALAYAAPEVADPKRHSTKMDVYSFGVLVVEVLTKTLPFQNLNTLKGRVQQQFPQYHQLVTSCTNQQSSDRPTMYDVIGQLNKIL